MTEPLVLGKEHAAAFSEKMFTAVGPPWLVNYSLRYQPSRKERRVDTAIGLCQANVTVRIADGRSINIAATRDIKESPVSLAPGTVARFCCELCGIGWDDALILLDTRPREGDGE